MYTRMPNVNGSKFLLMYDGDEFNIGHHIFIPYIICYCYTSFPNLVFPIDSCKTVAEIDEVTLLLFLKHIN